MSVGRQYEDQNITQCYLRAFPPKNKEHKPVDTSVIGHSTTKRIMPLVSSRKS